MRSLVLRSFMMVVMAAAQWQDRLAEFIGRNVVGQRWLISDQIGYLPLGCD